MNETVAPQVRMAAEHQNAYHYGQPEPGCDMCIADAATDERAQLVTRKIVEWIVGDLDYRDRAREIAAGGADRFGHLSAYLYGVIRATSHPYGSGAYVLQGELKPGDYHLIVWDDVADALAAE